MATETKKRERRAMAVKVRQWLNDNGIFFTEHNQGYHLKIAHDGGFIDVYPTTNKFTSHHQTRREFLTWAKQNLKAKR
jgi:hypothetical protein